MLTARSTNLPEKQPSKTKISCDIMRENISDFNKLTMDENWDTSLSDKEKQDAEEAILIPNNKRFVLFPIEYNEVWEKYKNIEAHFWSAEEIELSDDYNDWQTLSKKEQNVLLQVLAVFVSSDQNLGCNAVKRFGSDVQVAEARAFFGFQMMQSNIHTELYNVIFEMFSEVSMETDYLFDTLKASKYRFHTVHSLLVPSLSKRSAWTASNILESKSSFGQMLLSMAVFHRIFMSSSVALILHLQKSNRSLFHGLCKSVAKMSKDYHKYYEFALCLMKYLQQQPKPETIRRLVHEAVAIEKEFFQDIIGLSGNNLTLSGTAINPASMESYLQGLGNQILADMGLPGSHPVNGEQPLPWVIEILENEMNEGCNEGGKKSTYAPTPIKNSQSQQLEPQFSLEEDF